MAEHTATIIWQLEGEDFVANKYSRAHTWVFDGGLQVAASASPQLVPEPWSKPENVDPEEAFIAAVASCHMLFFLSIAAEQGFAVQSYRDEVVGILAKNRDGKYAITELLLQPKADFSGEQWPKQKELDDIHHRAHEQCFIANSVTSKITIKPR